MTNWKKLCFNLFYDIFVAALSVVDVISDAIVAVQFYQDGEMTYFWASIVVFAVAQVAYTFLFVIMYVSSGDNWKLAWHFFCVLPFGQAVPLIIWVQSFRFRWMDAFFKCVGWKVDLNTLAAADHDPLYDLIKEKVRTHGGFIIEGLVEAIPQSIIQMVAIVKTGNAAPINVFSITVSMVSVAARGFVVSYSIHRPTFVFNLACFVADVFNVFATVAWLFFTGDMANTYFVFWLNAYFEILSALWFWKEFAFFATLCTVLLSLLVVGVWIALSPYVCQFRNVRWCSCWRECGRACQALCCVSRRQCWRGGVELWKIGWAIIAYALFGVFLIAVLLIPVLVVIEGLRFAILPLFFLRSVDSPHATHVTFFGPLFDWLRETPSQFVSKIQLVNRHMANQFMVNLQLGRVKKSKRRKHATHVDVTSALVDRHPYSHETIARKMLCLSDERFTLAAYREICGVTPRARWLEYTQGLRELAGWGLLNVLLRVVWSLFLFLIFPMIVCNLVYSVIYPVLCFATTPVAEQQLLQLVLTVIYFADLVLILCLVPSVLSFQRCLRYVNMFSFEWLPQVKWVGHMQENYNSIWAHAEAKKQLSRTHVLPPELVQVTCAYMETPAYSAQAMCVDMETQMWLRAGLHDAYLNTYPAVALAPELVSKDREQPHPRWIDFLNAEEKEEKEPGARLAMGARVPRPADAMGRGAGGGAAIDANDREKKRSLDLDDDYDDDDDDDDYDNNNDGDGPVDGSLPPERKAERDGKEADPPPDVELGLLKRGNASDTSSLPSVHPASLPSAPSSLLLSSSPAAPSLAPPAGSGTIAISLDSIASLDSVASSSVSSLTSAASTSTPTPHEHDAHEHDTALPALLLLAPPSAPMAPGPSDQDGHLDAARPLLHTN